MNYYSKSSQASNTDDVAFATWPNPGAMGDNLYYPNLLVPQSTYPDPGYHSRSYVPDFNAADDAAFSPAPSTELGAFTDLPMQADFTNQVSSQCVGTSTRTYRAVPQNIFDPWSMLGPCMFFLRLPLFFVFTGCESKAHLNANAADPHSQMVGFPNGTRVDPLAAFLAATTPDVSTNASD